MNRLSSLAIVPFLAGLGACGSSNASSPSDGGLGDARPTADAGDDSTQGDDAGGNGTTEYDATLSGAEVVPAVVTSAGGAAKFVLQADGTTLTYDISHTVQNALAVAIHLASPGENGGVIFPLTPVSGHLTGSVTIASDQSDALASGQVYVDVQSQAHPDGEVRGQLLLPGSQIFVAAATGGQQVPAVSSTYHAHASFIESPDQGTLRYHFVTDAVPTDVRLHRAIGALNGPVAYPLAPVDQTIDGVLQIGGSDPDDLQHSRFYLNVVTAANPAGELRGQLVKPGETLYTGVLSGGNEVPPVSSQATGGAQLVLSPLRDQGRYEVVVSGVIPTGAEMDNAPAKQNGPMLYQLTLDASGAMGATPMKSSDYGLLTSGSVAVNVRTASYANGELRTQLQHR